MASALHALACGLAAVRAAGPHRRGIAELSRSGTSPAAGARALIAAPPQSRVLSTRAFQTVPASGSGESSAPKMGRNGVKENAPVLAGPLVSCAWLSSHLDNRLLRVLDASWFMPAAKRNAHDEFLKDRIPGSQFFDIDVVADKAVPLPHMLPAPDAFARACDALGITNDSAVVVYDRSGIFSAPRVWWMFRAFGHDRVAVLDGGMPAWREHVKDKPHLLDTRAATPEDSFASLRAAVEAKGGPAPAFQAKLDPRRVRDLTQVMAIHRDHSEQLLDARSEGRFKGTEPEPRPGLRGGHIPGAKNVPFDTVLMHSGAMRKAGDVAAMLASARIDKDRPITVSCGTGVTACVVALALDVIGVRQVAVYDGSWTEWGAREDTPVTKVEPTGSALGSMLG